ncbi:galactose-binding domain-like protein [Coniochaeta sp. 2T2.1]|nr:galactose-binding domain-like protein [Coniochaeta sp. 2T2.1]
MGRSGTRVRGLMSYGHVFLHGKCRTYFCSRTKRHRISRPERTRSSTLLEHRETTPLSRPYRIQLLLPKPLSHGWVSSKPMDGITKAGVGFYTGQFDLDLLAGYDIPLSFVFMNDTVTPSNHCCQLYVNGYQFGKYVSNIGPQTSYPVPEGILNHHGTNYVALSLLALDGAGVKVADLKLVADTVVQTSYPSPALSPQTVWSPRKGAY